MLERGTTLENNKYWIEGVVGRGGFGYVYRARERLTGEVVAIKELVPTFVDDPQMVQRFIQEARATLRLTHPHIARTYGVFQDRGTYYLAMEYLPGGSLADRLKQGPLAVKAAVRIAVNVCEALAYAHSRGVVHCDLKPDNVLFDARGEVYLADFGIAYVSEQMMTRHLFTATGVAMGTVRYMAPEQLEGVRDDPRLDIYAMGALMYEMLAGRPYLNFETESTPGSQMRNVQRIMNEPPRSLAAVGRPVPAWLVGVVERALEKAPEDRFASAEDLRSALRRGGRRPEVREAPPAKQAAHGPAPTPSRSREPASGDAPRDAPSDESIPTVVASGPPRAQVGSASPSQSRWKRTCLWVAAAGIGLLTMGCIVLFALGMAFPELGSVDEPSQPGGVVLQDPFDGNENGWKTEAGESEFWRGSVRIENGKLIWEVEEAHQDFWAGNQPDVDVPDDLTVSVSARRRRGSPATACYGLIYRLSEQGHYRFRICDDGKYHVGLRDGGTWETLSGWTESGAIRSGEVNKLAVRAVGAEFAFYINDEQVDSVSDGTFSSGGAGVLIDADEGDVAVFEFDDFVLRRE